MTNDDSGDFRSGKIDLGNALVKMSDHSQFHISKMEATESASKVSPKLLEMCLALLFDL